MPDSASTILQQVQPDEPVAPSRGETGLTIEPEGSAKLPPSAPFEVKSIGISGNSLFDTATLHALVADAEGKSINLNDLDVLAAKITEYYRSQGYPLARAIIPAQTIQNGVVELKVIEASYGQITLDNSSPVRDVLLQDTLATLQGGQAVGQAGLDHALLLLTDIPGIAVSATLKPGEDYGTSDLFVETTSGRAVTGSVVLDSYGNRYTGRERAGVAAYFNNPLHHGDAFSINGTTSGRGMKYGRIAYETLLNGQGTRLGAGYSALHYILGNTLSYLDGHGTAQVVSLWARHPLKRSRYANVYGKVQYERKQLRDSLDSALIQTDRHLNNWTMSLNGNALLYGAMNTWSVDGTFGNVGFDNSVAQSDDAISTNTQGRFLKWNASITRLQNLDTKSALYLSLSVQAANSNLDPSEKTVMGGPYTVRAYDMGAVSGDVGYLLTAELRHNLDKYWYGQWQVVTFVDSANVTENKELWPAATGPNSATLTGVGMGLNWSGDDLWSAKAYVAERIGTSPELVGDSATSRLWVEVGKVF